MMLEVKLISDKDPDRTKTIWVNIDHIKAIEASKESEDVTMLLYDLSGSTIAVKGKAEHIANRINNLIRSCRGA